MSNNGKTHSIPSEDQIVSKLNSLNFNDKLKYNISTMPDHNKKALTQNDLEEERQILKALIDLKK